ncbi:MAG: asparaginase [Desulfobacterales bacterium]|nr:MAG: asparaginase [Desulfobacterales bacterium]UCD90446.1 MAG: asparaginase [Desulfobacterales bacterium]
MKIKIYTVGGTIDKEYFDRKSQYEVGDPTIGDILKEAYVNFDFSISSILHKDSLDMTDQDRQMVFDRVASDEHQLIVLTHGTDTMIQTAQKLQAIPEKTIVLTGAMAPSRFKSSDAAFNIGCATAAVQILDHGVYIVMNGRIFHPDNVRKNLDRNGFEDTEE